jgi:NAD(P)-dependent dehydrogenase (short-subunit alcohol dehydrogenase family)
MLVMCKGSSVVLVSSLAARRHVGTSARRHVGTLSAYAATQRAIETLVKHFTLTPGTRGVRVNAIAPGVVVTSMSGLPRTASGPEATLGMQAFSVHSRQTSAAPWSFSPPTRRAG